MFTSSGRVQVRRAGFCIYTGQLNIGKHGAPGIERL